MHVKMGPDSHPRAPRETAWPAVLRVNSQRAAQADLRPAAGNRPGRFAFLPLPTAHGKQGRNQRQERVPGTRCFELRSLPAGHPVPQSSRGEPSARGLC